jgi:hypothetical protein
VKDAESGPVLYVESGASWWPVLWGPGFAAVGAVVEGFTPGPKHGLMWLLLAGILAVASAVWVYGRRRLCSVRITSSELRFGREALALARVEAVTDVGAPVGAKVLGGGWTAPRGTSEVPLRLDDGEVVLGWARDPVTFTEVLRPLVDKP